MDIIPSIYGQEDVGSGGYYAGNVFGDLRLKMGEVRAIIKPTDKESVSKKFNEYTVSVVQYENGMFARRLYYNCLLMNTIAGGGDKVYWTLRPSSKTSGEGNTATVADGSRVLVLCIEGSASRAYIIGGIRDERSEPDDPKLGHHFNWEFNGVNFRVNDDGSWSIVNKGKTTNLGGVAPSADKSGIGTTIKTEANGNIIINTPDNNQSIVIDNTNNSITINADSHITVNGNRIDIGKDANEPQVLGQQLVQLLQDLITAITSMSMFSFGTPTGPITSPPINSPQFLAIAARLETLLSHQSFVKRG